MAFAAPAPWGVGGSGHVCATPRAVTRALGLSASVCLPCLHPLWCSERGQRTRRGVEVAAGASGAGETRQPGNGTRASSAEETAAQYAVIAIVPVFCLMGLLGILVCNLLKRKGYHCTAHKEVEPGPGGGGGSGEARLGSGAEARGHGLAWPARPCLGAARGNLLGLEGLTGRGLIRRALWRCCMRAVKKTE